MGAPVMESLPPRPVTRGNTMRNAAITGWGMAVPERVLTNADLERMVETSDEWITSRTGIKERRIVGPEDSTTSLSVTAARQALDTAGLTANDIDLIVVATCTPDQFLVSQACLVQAELGGTAGAFDLGAACSGFVYALAVGSQFVQTGLHDRVMVIGVDTLTRFVDYTDRSTCILFGDGAGAVVLEATDEPRGLLSTVLGADGAGYKHLYIPGWGAFVPESAELFPEYRPYLHMNGQEVFRFAVRVMGDAAVEAVEKANLTFDDVDMMIPHQANMRIIDADCAVRSRASREAGRGGQRSPRCFRRRVGLGGRYGALGNSRRLPRSGMSQVRDARRGNCARYGGPRARFRIPSSQVARRWLIRIRKRWPGYFRDRVRNGSAWVASSSRSIQSWRRSTPQPTKRSVSLSVRSSAMGRRPRCRRHQSSSPPSC